MMKKRSRNKGPSSGNDGGAPVQPSADANYLVGYGKPPVPTQFQPGQSGNPKGRPAADPMDIRKLLGGIFEQRLTITEKGRRRSITKFEAAVTQLQNEAAKGDLASCRLLLAFAQLVYGKDLPPSKPVVNFIIEG
jgi:hypothetical protein